MAGVVVSGILVAGAGPWARAWGIPEAEPTVRALALALFCTTTAVVPLALLGHDLRFRTVMVIETGAIVLGLAAGVCLAIAMRSALALALGQAIGGVVLVIVAATLVRGRLHLRLDRTEARSSRRSPRR